jgi:hypothetical protein
MTDLMKQVLQMEEWFWRGGADVYRRHLAGDALMVFGPVGVMDRAAIVASVEASPRWEDVAFDDARLVPLTDDTCVVTYTARARRAGEAAYAALVSSVYVRRDGAWQMAFHQHTSPAGP